MFSTAGYMSLVLNEKIAEYLWKMYWEGSGRKPSWSIVLLGNCLDGLENPSKDFNKDIRFPYRD